MTMETTLYESITATVGDNQARGGPRPIGIGPRTALESL